MFNHHSPFLNSIISLLLFIPFTTLADSKTNSYDAKDYYLINCGLPKSSTQTGSQWQTSDEDFLVAPPSTTTNNPAPPLGVDPPYIVARIFRAPLTYSFPISFSGPKLVRLYLFPPPPLPPYKTIDDTINSFVSLDINGFNILNNFSAYQVAANANDNTNTIAPVTGRGGLVREVYVNVNESDGELALILKFSPGNTDGFGFIYGLEITSVPDGLYINQSADNVVPYLIAGVPQNYNFRNSLAMENVIRLNVGGKSLQPSEDTGMGRSWYMDNDFLLTFGIWKSFTLYNTAESLINYTASTVAEYTAPVSVYSTMRTIGPYDFADRMKLNLTWGFEVDGGFDYLVRLHFCEIDTTITEAGQRSFYISINEQTTPEFDVFGIANGVNIPIYSDFVTSVELPDNGSRALLWVAMLPDSTSKYNDVLLNGLEIFKLSNSTGSLVAPNPAFPRGMIPAQNQNATPRGKGSSNHRIPTIVGSILGVILASLAIIVCFIISYRRNKAKQIFMNSSSKQDSSKMKWVSPFEDSGSTATTASVISSLPSDLCRRFTLAQIKVATCDFDEDLVVGVGGFGKVYKGSIDGGASIVAIKRLNTTSKQGAHEFQTEIEMLSRLRHVHLVSLIGYCEDEGEMILVYEYMQQGSLRDHLMYKNPEKSLTPLSWKQRLMTCVGAAHGLHYLHAGARQLIIHRDVKSTNILLDDKWTAKVSDFGLSKAGPIPSELGPTHISTAVKGSAGYLDPEYYQRHRLTEKSDVYSFGVVLFEVLCARAAVNPRLPKEEANLAMWARNHYKRGTLHTIVDPNLTGQIAPESLRKFGEIAEMCVRDRGSERPSMGDIVWGLEFALQLQKTADNNNISGGPLVEDLGRPTNANLNGGSSGNTDNDVFSRSSVGAAATNRSLDSRTTTSDSSYCLVDTKSDAVFSEIIDPTAR